MYSVLIFHSRNVAEQIIERGLASVVRHKRDDEDRSPDYDKLMAAEQAYVTVAFYVRLSDYCPLTQRRQ